MKEKYEKYPFIWNKEVSTWTFLEKSGPGRQMSHRKCLVYLRNSKEASVTGREGAGDTDAKEARRETDRARALTPSEVSSDWRVLSRGGTPSDLL